MAQAVISPKAAWRNLMACTVRSDEGMTRSNAMWWVATRPNPMKPDPPIPEPVESLRPARFPVPTEAPPVPVTVPAQVYPSPPPAAAGPGLSGPSRNRYTTSGPALAQNPPDPELPHYSTTNTPLTQPGPAPGLSSTGKPLPDPVPIGNPVLRDPQGLLDPKADVPPAPAPDSPPDTPELDPALSLAQGSSTHSQTTRLGLWLVAIVALSAYVWHKVHKEGRDEDEMILVGGDDYYTSSYHSSA